MGATSSTYYILLSLNVPGDLKNDRKEIYDNLQRLGLKKIDKLDDEKVFTTFKGWLTVPENPPSDMDECLQSPDVDIRKILDFVLKGCGYVFMWNTRKTIGGPAAD